jgi:hypothetical protein
MSFPISVHAPSKRWTGFIAVYSALGLFFAWYATIELKRNPVGIGELVSLYACLLMLLAFYLAAGFTASRSWLIERLHGERGAIGCLAIFVVPYLIYALGTGDFRWLAFLRLIAIAAPPLLLLGSARIRDPGRLHWQDLLALLWLMAPVFAGQIGGIWNVPVNLDFMARLFMVGVGSWAFLIFRSVPDSGYEFALSLHTPRDVIGNFGGFALIALPLGYALHFIKWNPQWHGAPAFASDLIVIFPFIAVTEELFFRGLIQNLLEGSFRSRYAAQAITALLFGLSHIRHAPYPNWRYVALATVAGWFYGSAYRAHRSLMASAITHALVDTLWRTFFTLPKG